MCVSLRKAAVRFPVTTRFGEPHVCARHGDHAKKTSSLVGLRELEDNRLQVSNPPPVLQPRIPRSPSPRRIAPWSSATQLLQETPTEIITAQNACPPPQRHALGLISTLVNRSVLFSTWLGSGEGERATESLAVPVPSG